VAITKIFESFTGTSTGATLDDDEDGLVARGVAIYSTDAQGIVGTGSHNVSVFGQVFGRSGGISLGNSIVSTSQLQILQINSGASVSSMFSAIDFYGSSNRLTNAGEVSGQNGVSGSSSAAGAFVNITNHGDILTLDYCVTLYGEMSLQLKNFGTISSDIGEAIVSNGNAQNNVTNRGLINGALRFGNGDDRIANRGIINGDISFGGGINFLDNRGGTIDGTIFFGANNDTFKPGAGDEIANGNAGVDTLDFTTSGSVTLSLDNSLAATGSARGDVYSGFENITGSNGGDDVLVGDFYANGFLGLNGNDRLSGMAGNDFLDGGAGNDIIDGGADTDLLNGGSGNDTLLGGAGFDYLIGNSGDDVLTGGLSRDTLEGEAGADRFVFLARDFVGINQSAPDTINDFNQVDRDVIDLLAVDANTNTTGNQAFKFIGAQPFQNIAGQLRFQQSGANTFVYGDTNGDGTSDFTIKLGGLLTLAEKDFIL
jgi:Ca2+-binding RTX toxin-like protein